MLLSALEIRFSPRHWRDDYRSASVSAINALNKGQIVWWNADPNPAVYYALPFAPSRNGAVELVNPTADYLVRLPSPNVIIISKPDVYDVKQSVSRFVRESNMRLIETPQAFKIWAR